MIISGAGAIVKYCIIIKAVFVLSGTTPTVQNCTVYDTVAEAKSTCTIQNTIGRNTLIPAIDINIDSGKTVTGQYNCFQDAGKSGSGTYTDTGSLWSSDPLFLNAAAYDFRLLSTSPCINAGVNVGLTADYEGKGVPRGRAPDIGAYEYQQATGRGGRVVLMHGRRPAKKRKKR